MSTARAGFGITPGQQEALDGGRVIDFWDQRANAPRPDPISRTGLAIWEKKDDFWARVARGMDENPAFWRPKITLPAAIVLWWKTGLQPPRTTVQTQTYWSRLGAMGRERLDEALKDHGVSDPAERQRLMKEIALELAKAHAAAIREDIRAQRGAVPGLLGPADVARYHRQTFARYGLPPAVYAGTPSPLVWDALELMVASSLYLHDGDWF